MVKYCILNSRICQGENILFLFHKHFVASKYLDIVKTESHRIALGRLRSSNHRLAIESGRWHKPHLIPVDKTKCMLCDDIEDEYHFICISQLYKKLRKRYIPEYYFERPDMHKVIELMSNDDTKTVCNLANFVFKAFLIRKSHMTIST